MIKLATKNKVINIRNFIDNFIIERHHIIVEEADVINALYVINSNHVIAPDIKVNNCGWADDTHKWYIHFTTTRLKWMRIRTMLKVIRVFANVEIPKNTVGFVYTTD